MLNAQHFKEQGFSHVLEQEEMNPETLMKAIDALYSSAGKLKERMKQERAAAAADTVSEIIADAAK